MRYDMLVLEIDREIVRRVKAKDNYSIDDILGEFVIDEKDRPVLYEYAANVRRLNKRADQINTELMEEHGYECEEAGYLRAAVSGTIVGTMLAYATNAPEFLVPATGMATLLLEKAFHYFGNRRFELISEPHVQPLFNKYEKLREEVLQKLNGKLQTA